MFLTTFNPPTGTIPTLPPLTGGVLDLSHNAFHGNLPSFTNAPLQYGFDRNCEVQLPTTTTYNPITFPFNLTTYTDDQTAKLNEEVVFQLSPQGQQNCGVPTIGQYPLIAHHQYTLRAP